VHPWPLNAIIWKKEAITVDESRWYNSAEAYRAVQGLVRDGRYREALDRALLVLQDGALGRRHTARLHSQICWLYIEQMHQTCPAAALHGEEAVRMAELVRDQWVRTEALSRLVHAYCRLGDLERARDACREIARELEANDQALVGGHAALLLLEATVALAEGDAESCLSALQLAGELAESFAPALRMRVRLQQALSLLEFGRPVAARQVLGQESPPPGLGPEGALEWDLARAWLAVAELPPDEALSTVDELADRAVSAGHAAVMAQCLALKALLAERAQTGEAECLARQAVQRCLTAGRRDLVSSLRRRLAHLLA
jgi:tetratricopeptide (TPR) repeat protein